MNRRDKLKNIFSWISLGCGILTFLYLFFLAFVIGPFKWEWLPDQRYIPDIWSILLVAIAAIFTGFYGIIGKANRYVRNRSCTGLVLGIFYWVIFGILVIFFIEW